MNKELILLNDIYREILGRDVDDSGIATYLPRLQQNTHVGKFTIAQDLRSSSEYLNRGGEFNSLTGDRSAYISQNDLSVINTSKFKNLVNFLIKEIIYLENPNYPSDKLENRIDTIKKSITFSGEKGMSFTIFPHMEYDFCTDRFNNSLKNIRNYQYFTAYLSLCGLWKVLFGKTVETCGTIPFVNKLINGLVSRGKTYESLDINDIVAGLSEDIIKYLSIRICGRELIESEMQTAQNYIQNKNSNGLITFLNSLVIDEQNKETTLVEQTINTLTQYLGRKPKVLIMVAYLETQNQYFLEKMMYHLVKVKEYNTLLDIDFALDNERISKEQGDYTPWSRVKRIRNLMINKYPIHEYDYLYIID